MSPDAVTLCETEESVPTPPVPLRARQKPDHVLEDEFQIASAWGFKLPRGMERSEFIEIVKSSEKAECFGEDHPDLKEHYRAMMKRIHALRHRIAHYVRQALNDPLSCSSALPDDFEWRETQAECLDSLIWCFRHGYFRLPVQMPTGGGKSHILGAVTWATLRAMHDLSIDEEILMLTPMENLVRQLGGKKTADDQAEVNGNTEDSDLTEGEDGVKLGDVRMWTEDFLSDEQVRILTGEPKFVAAEKKKKDSLLSIATYASFKESTLRSRHTRSIGMRLDDEAHCVTERVRTVSDHCTAGSFGLGVSATIYGPGRNPYHYFQAVHRPEDYGQEDVPWTNRLAYYASRETMINRRELKPVRLIPELVDIDLSKIKKSSGGSFRESDVHRVFSLNLPSLKAFLKYLVEKEYDCLTNAGTAQLRDRTAIIPVKLVDIAEELAGYMRDVLNFPAEWVSGAHTSREFDAIQDRLISGETRWLFTCKKATIGFNLDRANAVIGCWPHPKKSAWMLDQELGRACRKNPEDPHDDCVYVQPMYKAGQHKLAIVQDLFDQKFGFCGGLVARGPMRDLETKIYRGLKEERSPMDILCELSPEEFELAEQLGWQFIEKSKSGYNVLEPTNEKIHISFHQDEMQEWSAIRHEDDIPEDGPEFWEWLRDETVNKGYTNRYEVLARWDSFAVEVFGSAGSVQHILRNKVDDDRIQCTGSVKVEHVWFLVDEMFPVEKGADLRYFQALMAKGGYFSRSALIHADPAAVRKQAFPPFASGTSLNRVLNKLARDSFPCDGCSQLADAIWPLSENALIEELSDELAEHGIVTRADMESRDMPFFENRRQQLAVFVENRTGKIFKSSQFQYGPNGKIRPHFAEALLGAERETTDRTPVPAETSRGRQARMRAALAQMGFFNRAHCLHEHALEQLKEEAVVDLYSQFRSLRWSNNNLPFEYRNAFLHIVHQAYPMDGEQWQEVLAEGLSALHVSDWKSFLECDVEAFRDQDFGFYGTGESLGEVIMGQSFLDNYYKLDQRDLAEISVKIFSVSREELIADVRSAFEYAGYDQQSMRRLNPKSIGEGANFSRLHLPRYGGAGIAFKLVMGYHCSHRGKKSVMEFVDVLFNVERKKQESLALVEQARTAVAASGIGRLELLKMTSSSFGQRVFGDHWTGFDLFELLTGEKLRPGGETGNSQLRQLADTLFPEGETEAQNNVKELDWIRDEIGKKGFTSRFAIFGDYKNFMKMKFGVWSLSALYNEYLWKTTGERSKKNVGNAEAVSLINLLYPMDRAEELRITRHYVLSAGIFDRKAILQTPPEKWKSMQIGPFTEVSNLMRVINGNGEGFFRGWGDVYRIADTLFPVSPEQIREEILDVLQRVGVTTPKQINSKDYPKNVLCTRSRHLQILSEHLQGRSIDEDHFKGGGRAALRPIVAELLMPGDGSVTLREKITPSRASQCTEWRSDVTALSGAMDRRALLGLSLDAFTSSGLLAYFENNIAMTFVDREVAAQQRRLADKVYPIGNAQWIQEVKGILAEGGIHSREELLAAMDNFTEHTFGDRHTGGSLYECITGDTVQYVESHEMAYAVAHTVFPIPHDAFAQELQDESDDALRGRDILQMSFGKFGQGKEVFHILTGKRVYQDSTDATLSGSIVDSFLSPEQRSHGPESPAFQTVLHSALVKGLGGHGYRSRIRSMHVHDFAHSYFGVYGRGFDLYRTMTGEELCLDDEEGDQITHFVEVMNDKYGLLKDVSSNQIAAA